MLTRGSESAWWPRSSCIPTRGTSLMRQRTSLPPSPATVRCGGRHGRAFVGETEASGGSAPR
jgi:hypothetical protein